ncbi:phage Gp37/Gp68 family protein [Cupriavidus nantongensis]|uniref:phage Gp37/Gp68 family protein n=1 Tax=Cupriavidus nantongensis TaxID=1796606 RepID=UPI00358E9282
MSANSKIEWTDHTFNPWEGCQKVGPGCDHCYAETRNARFGGGVAVNWGPGAPRRRTSAANWRKPLAWNSNHDAFFAEHGRRQRVFCASLADVFDNAVSVQWRYDLLRLIMDTPNLDWLLLTKRIGNAAGMLEQAMRALTIQREGWADNYLPNVWIGATIVNQAEADRDIPKLLAVPARVRFLSMEPLLGPVEFSNVSRRSDAVRVMGQRALGGIDWVIVGGESGPGARPMHPDWARSLRDQCAAAGVPFLFKQHGEWAPGAGDFGAGRFETAAVAHDGRVAAGGFDAGAYPAGAAASDGWAMVHRAGKRAAGRLLDGMQHDGFPV